MHLAAQNTVQNFSLDEAIQFALENNRIAKNASRDIEAAETELSEYIRTTSREILLGESADDETDEDESNDKMTDDKEDESDGDSKDDDDSEEDDSDDDDSDDSDDDSKEDESNDKETIKEDVTDDKIANIKRALKSTLKKLKADKSGRQSIDTNIAIINNDLATIAKGNVTGLVSYEKDILSAERALSKS